MLKLAAIHKSQEIECTKHPLGTGACVSVIRSERAGVSDLEFTITTPCICMVMNYGDPVFVKNEGSKHRLGYKKCNVFDRITGHFALSLENKGNYLVYLVVLQLDYYHSLLAHFSTVLEKQDTRGQQSGKLFINNLQINSEISHHLHQLDLESMESDGAIARVYGRLLVMLSQLFSQQGTRRTKPRSNTNFVDDEKMARIHQVERIVRTDFSTPYTLKELAKLIGTNECYLKQVFKATFGLPVQAYQKKVKMELAHTMLLNTEKSIGAISKRLGYKYVTHFNAAFKRFHGETPGNVRADVRRGVD